MDNNHSRRHFLAKTAKLSAITAGAVLGLGWLRSLYPTLTGSDSRVKIGRLHDYPIQTFTVIDEHGIFIFRDHTGVRALSAICTHLGCTLHATEYGFSCPCHGSHYDQEGRVLAGPAPQALDWLQVELTPDGHLQVDKNRRVAQDDKLRVS